MGRRGATKFDAEAPAASNAPVQPARPATDVAQSNRCNASSRRTVARSIEGPETP